MILEALSLADELPESLSTEMELTAVTFALPDESRSFVKRLENVRLVPDRPFPLILGNLGPRSIVVFHTGVGDLSADERIRSFLKNHRPGLILCSGFAGGLSPFLKTGMVVVASNFSDPILFEKTRTLWASLPSVYFGLLSSQSAPAESVPQKKALFEETGADAVDMETLWISTACSEASVPMLSIRGISDPADFALPVPFHVWFDLENQKPKIWNLLIFLISHPGVIPVFFRFVRGIRMTGENMADRISEFLFSLEK